MRHVRRRAERAVAPVCTIRSLLTLPSLSTLPSAIVRMALLWLEAEEVAQFQRVCHWARTLKGVPAVFHVATNAWHSALFKPERQEVVDEDDGDDRLLAVRSKRVDREESSVARRVVAAFASIPQEMRICARGARILLRTIMNTTQTRLRRLTIDLTSDEVAEKNLLLQMAESGTSVREKFIAQESVAWRTTIDLSTLEELNIYSEWPSVLLWNIAGAHDVADAAQRRYYDLKPFYGETLNDIDRTARRLAYDIARQRYAPMGIDGEAPPLLVLPSLRRLRLRSNGKGAAECLWSVKHLQDVRLPSFDGEKEFEDEERAFRALVHTSAMTLRVLRCTLPMREGPFKTLLCAARNLHTLRVDGRFEGGDMMISLERLDSVRSLWLDTKTPATTILAACPNVEIVTLHVYTEKNVSAVACLPRNACNITLDGNRWVIESIARHGLPIGVQRLAVSWWSPSQHDDRFPNWPSTQELAAKRIVEAGGATCTHLRIDIGGSYPLDSFDLPACLRDMVCVHNLQLTFWCPNVIETFGRNVTSLDVSSAKHQVDSSVLATMSRLPRLKTLYIRDNDNNCIRFFLAAALASNTIFPALTHVYAVTYPPSAVEVIRWRLCGKVLAKIRDRRHSIVEDWRAST